jgi:hypothetical protein
VGEEMPQRVIAMKVLIMSSGGKLGLPKSGEYNGRKRSLRGVRSSSFSLLATPS